jgi:aryl-alcohol dehydrogenase-like predicted oxidoreductase
MARLAGRATPQGTRRFAARAADRVAEGHFRSAPGDLALSSVGLGTYLGRPDGPTDLAVESAVTLCLRSGRVNVVDTAINYRFQRAERSVGRALARAVAGGVVEREEVFVSTKAGYLAPDVESPLPLDQWVGRTLVAPGILGPDDIVDGCHAMTPAYLEDQVERSRSNLGLETIDLVYLHNAPDTQLPRVGRDEFARRLADAFRSLERMRSEGKIVAYGLATWDALRVPSTDPAHLSIEEALTVARTAGGDAHGLRFVQLPFNLAMPEAATAPVQPVGGTMCSPIAAAHHLGLGCFTSIPLAQGRLARSGPAVPPLSRAQTAIQFARSAPGTLAPLVGQKSAPHLSEDLAVAERAPWPPSVFSRMLG